MTPRKGFLFERLTSHTTLNHAWEEVLRHYTPNAAPADIRAFEQHRDARLRALSQALKSARFVPAPAALIYIAKPGHAGEQRTISLIPPDDRIVLCALNRLLTPLFERGFLPGSFAYRAGKSASAAIECVTANLRAGLIHAAAGDVDNFFPGIDRAQLLTSIRRVVFENPVLELLETWLHMGSVRGVGWIDSPRGIAQGSPLSPLLSNIAMTAFDRYLNEQSVSWVRYADNFILMGQDASQVKDGFARAEAFLLERCGLSLNTGSRIFASETDGFDFLGFRFRAGRRQMTASKLDLKRTRLREILCKERNCINRLVADLNQTVAGWIAYYGKSADTRDQFLALEQHLEQLLRDWLLQFRASPAAKQLSAADLKAGLSQLTLPFTHDAGRRIKWIELLLARSRPARPAEAVRGLSPAARRAIEQRKEEYRKLRLEREEILITRPGTYLGRTGERLMIRHEGKREAELPLSMIRNITALTKAISISGDLMAEAAARGIAITIAGSEGRPVVRIGAPEAAEHHLSLLQSGLASEAGGLELARIIVAGKIRNQANLLRYYLKYPERRADGDFLTIATTGVRQMEALRDSVRHRVFDDDRELERNRLFASEGQAAAVYWGCVRSLLWWKPGFEARTRRGAGDLVNSLLNYGYGILYSRLLTILLRTGLNVYVGFLHKPQKDKAGLLFDFIEEFRAGVVDRTVFSMLNLGIEAKISVEGLDMETRRELAKKVIHRLQTPTRYHGESIPLEKVLEHQARLLVQHIEGSGVYKTWVLPW